jgi:hypothetical protein
MQNKRNGRKKGQKILKFLNCGRVSSSNNSFKKCDRMEFALDWFTITFREVKDLFHHNFQTCLWTHPLGFKGVNHGIIIKVQQEVMQRAITRMWAWGHMLNHGLFQPNYHQGKRLLNKKKELKKQKKHMKIRRLLFAHHLTTTTIL